jgi:hypothetical protein
MSRTKSAETVEFEALVARIQANLTRNNAWIERALIVLHDRQTDDEKYVQHTRHDNQKGFNKPDATTLSTLAEIVKAGCPLTTDQYAEAAIRLRKYTKQLARIAQEKRKAA